MQSSLTKQRLRVPYYYWQIFALVLYLIIVILNLFMPTRSSISSITGWNILIYPVLAIQVGINIVSFLDISANGLVMRRGWQRFTVNWEQIESFGIGSLSRRRYLPYIILRQPIQGLPTVKLQELTPEQHKRTLTLEGWNNAEIIAQALHDRLNSTPQQWQVAPDFSKGLKVFYYYQRMYIWAMLVVLSIFIYSFFL